MVVVVVVGGDERWGGVDKVVVVGVVGGDESGDSGRRGKCRKPFVSDHLSAAVRSSGVC